VSRFNLRLDPAILLIGYRYTFLDHWHGLPSEEPGEIILLSSIIYYRSGAIPAPLPIKIRAALLRPALFAWFVGAMAILHI
jgi:hypothetical protein